MSVLLSSTLANPTTSYYALAGAGGGGVSQIVAGTGISVSPVGGTGVVTISAPITTGMILMFNGVSAPTGWAICDGTQGTPNLLDKFVICASPANYPSGSSGGAASVALTLNMIPNHIHGGAAVLGSGGTAGINDYNVTGIGGDTSGITTPGYVAGTPVPTIPPYYALAFIMKL
jgi:hypothetical protein